LVVRSLPPESRRAAPAAVGGEVASTSVAAPACGERCGRAGRGPEVDKGPQKESEREWAAGLVVRWYAQAICNARPKFSAPNGPIQNQRLALQYSSF
jgi:hypothetical protein